MTLLTDRYTLETGTLHLTGIQALRDVASYRSELADLRHRFREPVATA